MARGIDLIFVFTCSYVIKDPSDRGVSGMMRERTQASRLCTTCSKSSMICSLSVQKCVAATHSIDCRA